MKITAKVSGGFAGRSECYQLDTACDANGLHAEQLLQQLDFFGAAPPYGIGADIPRWEITVDDGPRCRTVTVPEDGSSGGGRWQALLAHLRKSQDKSML